MRLVLTVNQKSKKSLVHSFWLLIDKQPFRKVFLAHRHVKVRPFTQLWARDGTESRNLYSIFNFSRRAFVDE
jgi:hypothetical protein